MTARFKHFHGLGLLSRQISAVLQGGKSRPGQDIENEDAKKCWDDNCDDHDDGEHVCCERWFIHF